jgi:hypothetical protein
MRTTIVRVIVALSCVLGLYWLGTSRGGPSEGVRVVLRSIFGGVLFWVLVFKLVRPFWSRLEHSSEDK